MSQQQGRITDNLANIINMIQQQRMSGELRAKRSEDTNEEVGLILFTDGQVVYAQVGSYRGVVAFKTLYTWKQSIFIFVASSSNSTHQTPSLSQSSPVLPSPSRPLQPLPPTQRDTLPLPANEQQQANAPTDSISLITVPRATMSVIKAIGVINQASLPRTYRQVFLLIDGQHSVNDLIGMTGISREEILQMLRTLESLAVIILSK